MKNMGLWVLLLAVACGGDDAERAHGDAGAAGHDAGVGPDAAGPEEGDAGDLTVDAGPPCANTPSYAELRDTIFVTRCASGRCHGGTGEQAPGPPRPTGKVPLGADSTREGLVNVSSELDASLKLVVPYDPGHSFLMAKLNNDLPEDGSLGQPMPLGEAIQWQMLPEGEIEQVRCWIRGGAP